MNVEKLKRLQVQVRIGGKGTLRRKKKVTYQTAMADDKKLQSALKKLSVSTIPGIEEVNIIKEDLTVIHLNNPKAQASLSANIFAVTGHGEHKKVVEMLPEILPQLGHKTVVQLRSFANSMSSNQIMNASGEQTFKSNIQSNADNDMPVLVSDFDEISKGEDLTVGKIKTKFDKDIKENHVQHITLNRNNTYNGLESLKSDGNGKTERNEHDIELDESWNAGLKKSKSDDNPFENKIKYNMFEKSSNKDTQPVVKEFQMKMEFSTTEKEKIVLQEKNQYKKIESFISDASISGKIYIVEDNKKIISPLKIDDLTDAEEVDIKLKNLISLKQPLNQLVDVDTEKLCFEENSLTDKTKTQMLQNARKKISSNFPQSDITEKFSTNLARFEQVPREYELETKKDVNKSTTQLKIQMEVLEKALEKKFPISANFAQGLKTENLEIKETAADNITHIEYLMDKNEEKRPPETSIENETKLIYFETYKNENDHEPPKVENLSAEISFQLGKEETDEVTYKKNQNEVLIPDSKMLKPKIKNEYKTEDAAGQGTEYMNQNLQQNISAVKSFKPEKKQIEDFSNNKIDIFLVSDSKMLKNEVKTESKLNDGESQEMEYKDENFNAHKCTEVKTEETKNEYEAEDAAGQETENINSNIKQNLSAVILLKPEKKQEVSNNKIDILVSDSKFSLRDEDEIKESKETNKIENHTPKHKSKINFNYNVKNQTISKQIETKKLFINASTFKKTSDLGTKAKQVSSKNLIYQKSEGMALISKPQQLPKAQKAKTFLDSGTPSSTKEKVSKSTIILTNSSTKNMISAGMVKVASTAEQILSNVEKPKMAVPLRETAKIATIDGITKSPEKINKPPMSKANKAKSCSGISGSAAKLLLKNKPLNKSPVDLNKKTA